MDEQLDLTRAFLLVEIVSRQSGRYTDDYAIFDTRGITSDRPGWDDVVTSAFLACEEHGYLASVSDKRLMSSQIAYRVTDLGEQLLSDTETSSLRDHIGVSPKGKLPSSGDRALWVWLLRSGGPICFMDSGPDLDNGNMLHLKACGLDLDRSSSVQDEVWTTKAGTFAEEERGHGVGGEAVCRCGLVGGHERDFRLKYDRDLNPRPRPEGGGPLRIYAEVAGIVDLLRAML